MAAGELAAAAEDIMEEILESGGDAMDTGGADVDVLSFGSGEHPASHGEGEDDDDDVGMESEEESDGDLLSEDRYNSAGEEVKCPNGVC